MSSQLRKTRSMDSSCLELRPGPPSGNVSNTTYQGPSSHLSTALSRARSEANLHASTLSLDPGKSSSVIQFLYQQLIPLFYRHAKAFIEMKNLHPNILNKSLLGR